MKWINSHNTTVTTVHVYQKINLSASSRLGITAIISNTI